MRIGRRTPLGVAVTAALLVLAPLPASAGGWISETSAPAITSPRDRSQARRSGDVPVEIDFGRAVTPSSVSVQLVTGLGRPAPRRTEIKGRLRFSGTRASGRLTADDLLSGPSQLNATIGRGNRASSRFSWEPSLNLAASDRCDFLAPRRCLFPFPNDWFTTADSTTATGRRVDLQRISMPKNVDGVHIDPTEWDRNDGFSPGSLILTHVPGLDLTATGAVPITDIGRSFDAAAPIVVIDAATGRRQPIWTELDANATTPAEQALLIRPARNLLEGHRYIVALRDLKSASGKALVAGRAFRLYRDRIPTYATAVERRRPHIESLFATLQGAGVERQNLNLAWDFTVASGRNLSERILHIRDDAFAALHGAAPSFTVTQVENEVDDEIYRRVTGTFRVPNYLTGQGEPGSRFTHGPNGLPVRNGTQTASFICIVPRWATAHGFDPVRPARPSVYGHGLLGSNDEVNAGNVRAMANEHGFLFCATKWIGLAEEDIANDASILEDFSDFPTLADRCQQGILNTLFLGRLMKHPQGFVSHPAFRAGARRTPLIDTSTLFYDGNSQGGIMGGAATAVAQDWTRAVLGVPGMNYSTLLDRSADFVSFQEALFKPNYPSPLDRQLILSAVQMLWDRAETNGYAEHLTRDPYRGTPTHTVLLHEAFGDHQVANIAAETEARTIGAHLRRPGLARGRSTDVVPFFGIPPINRYPWPGSALVMWDSGTPAPPTTNTPPTAGEDPHENPRSQASARVQKSEFLRRDGRVIDVCGAGPCLAPD